ncbi:MAG: response regulator transcription factor [Pseudomonadota bacterium]
MKKIRVMLADDHTQFREALRMWLELATDMEVVAEAYDSHSVLEGAGASQPDVVCMDVNLQGLNGIETTRQLLALYPDIKVVGLSAHVDPGRVAEMLSAGARGYVAKGSPGDEVLAAIRMVSQDRHYLSPELELKH